MEFQFRIVNTVFEYGEKLITCTGKVINNKCIKHIITIEQCLKITLFNNTFNIRLQSPKLHTNIGM